MSKAIWVTREELDHMNLYQPFKQFLELEKEWINNNKDDILVKDYNPATDRGKYKWDPNLKKTIYIGNKGAVKKAPEPKKETKTEENKEEKNDQLTIDHLNERLKTLGFDRINNIDKVDKKM